MMRTGIKLVRKKRLFFVDLQKLIHTTRNISFEWIASLSIASIFVSCSKVSGKLALDTASFSRLKVSCCLTV